MNGRRLFLDPAFVLALHARADQFHGRAVKWFQVVRRASEVWTTEAVLIEVGNAFSASNRAWAVNFNRDMYRTPNVKVVPISGPLLNRAWQLYADRPDKQCGLTDCMSFTVMAEQSLTEALTTDHHFVQSGFIALLHNDPQ